MKIVITKESLKNPKVLAGLITGSFLILVVLGLVIYSFTNSKSLNQIQTLEIPQLPFSYVTSYGTIAISYPQPASQEMSYDNAVVSYSAYYSYPTPDVYPDPNNYENFPLSYAQAQQQYFDYRAVNINNSEKDHQAKMINAGIKSYSCDDVSTGTALDDLKNALTGTWNGDIYIRDWNSTYNVQFIFKDDSTYTANSMKSVGNSPFYYYGDTPDTVRNLEFLKDDTGCKILLKTDISDDAGSPNITTLEDIQISNDGKLLSFITRGYNTDGAAVPLGPLESKDALRYYVEKQI